MILTTPTSPHTFFIVIEAFALAITINEVQGR
jgi:hypothetical protein